MSSGILCFCSVDNLIMAILPEEALDDACCAPAQWITEIDNRQCAPCSKCSCNPCKTYAADTDYHCDCWDKGITHTTH